jgi:hypothetical protein
MEIRRRGFLAGLFLAAATAQVVKAQSNDPQADEPLFSNPDPLPTEADFEGMEQLAQLPAGFVVPDHRYTVNYGAKEPPEFYTRIANILLRGAPIKCRPVDVARYFYDIRNKLFTADVRDRLETLFANQRPRMDFNPDFVSIFAYDWERNEYYNPLIVKIITGSRTAAYDGDLTPWCASFANWCIARSQASNPRLIEFDSLLDFGTRSAASGSFRCWGETASEPSYGDIVVYAKRGTEEQQCPVNLNNAQGHVGFYVGQRVRANGSLAYDLLGGNQGFVAPASGLTLEGSVISQADLAQAVSIRGMGLAWSDRVFHSIRTSSLLRG